MLDPTAISDPKRTRPEGDRGPLRPPLQEGRPGRARQGVPRPADAQVHASASPAEETAFDALVDLKFSAIDQRRHGAMLFKTTLEKALFSSPAACRQTIAERIKTIGSRKGDADFARRRAACARSMIASPRSMRLVLEVPAAPPAHRQQEGVRLVAQGQGRPARDLQRAHRDAEVPPRAAPAEDLDLKDEQIELLHGGSPTPTSRRSSSASGRTTRRSASSSRPTSRPRASTSTSSATGSSTSTCRGRSWSSPSATAASIATARSSRRRSSISSRSRRTRRSAATYASWSCSRARSAGAGEHRRPLGADGQVRRREGGRSHRAGDRGGESTEAFGAARDRRAQPARPPPPRRADARPPPPPPGRPTFSLFDSDFAYVREVLDLLARERRARARRPREGRAHRGAAPARHRGSTASAHSPAPTYVAGSASSRVEVVPDDGVLVLTPDRHRIQDEIKLARREESAWPKVSYLWPLHPVVDWCNDKAVAHLGRMEAPIISLIDGIAVDEAVVLVSALLPNRRSQALFQEWYAVRFVGGAQKERCRSRCGRSARRSPADHSQTGTCRSTLPRSARSCRPRSRLRGRRPSAHWAEEEKKLKDQARRRAPAPQRPPRPALRPDGKRRDGPDRAWRNVRDKWSAPRSAPRSTSSSSPSFASSRQHDRRERALHRGPRRVPHEAGHRPAGGECVVTLPRHREHNEFFTQHYLTAILQSDLKPVLERWRAANKEPETPATGGLLPRPESSAAAGARGSIPGPSFGTSSAWRARSTPNVGSCALRDVDGLLADLGYAEILGHRRRHAEEAGQVALYGEMKRADGSPLLWLMPVVPPRQGERPGTLSTSSRRSSSWSRSSRAGAARRGLAPPAERTSRSSSSRRSISTSRPGSSCCSGSDDIVLVERAKWAEQRLLRFDLREILGRRQPTRSTSPRRCSTARASSRPTGSRSSTTSTTTRTSTPSRSPRI
jgi:hypothetical protein